MEPDGITRLYYYYEQPNIKVVEAAPNNENRRKDLWITGTDAKEIYDRADLFCVSVAFGNCYKRKNNHIWSVYPKEGYHKLFDVWRARPYEKADYIDLIRKLERRMKKKGLTVLIS